MRRIGIDIGGVIIERAGSGDTSFFGENYLETPEVPDAFRVIKEFARAGFGNNRFLISKAGPQTEARTLEWLEHRNFFNETGITPDNVLFTRTREGKVPIAQELQLTDFIDDKAEVLGHLAGTVKRLYLLNPSEDEPQAQSDAMTQVTASFSTWIDLERHIHIQ